MKPTVFAGVKRQKPTITLPPAKSFAGITAGLSRYRAAMLAALDPWRDTQTVSVGTPPITLSASQDSQHNFAALAVATQLGMSAGATTGDTKTWLVDADGVRHDMSTSALLATLTAYAGAVQTMMATYYANQAAIGKAASVRALDAITFG